MLGRYLPFRQSQGRREEHDPLWPAKFLRKSNTPTPELGKVGAEHVLNLLARLKGDAPVMPAITLQSGLSLREEPQANVSRYEALRTVQGDHHVA